MFTWKDYKRSQILFLFILILFNIVNVLPMRYVILLLYTKKFLKGRHFYEKKYKNNIQILEMAIRDFLYYGHKIVLELTSKAQWARVSNEMASDLVESIMQKHSLIINSSMLCNFNTALDFIDYAAYCRPRLKPQYSPEINDQLYEKNTELFKLPVEEEVYLMNYISTIPSDYYLSKHSLPIYTLK
jgi:hypothetical protein